MRPLDILHEDERLVAVMKPPGLLTVKPPRGSPRRRESTLLDRLRAQGLVLLPIHRLDAETSGVVLLARDEESRAGMMRAFRAHEVEKTYLAFVQGRPDPGAGVIRAPILDRGARAEISRRGQKAVTRYRVIETFALASLLEVVPETGRHNQIRIHFAHIGHPLVGERKYARGSEALVRHKRAALHAARLTFTPPWSTDPLHIQAPLPVDLQNLSRKLRGS